MRAAGGDGDRREAGGGSGTGPARLRHLEGGGQAPPPSPSVRLVREYKGPVVSELLDPTLAQGLPGKVRAVQQLVERGALADAEQALDRTGRVLHGEFRSSPRRWPWLRLYLWLVLALLALAWWTRG